MTFDNPLASFTVLLLVSLLVPPVFERLRLPGLIGLLVAGVALGPEGLGWLDADSDTMKLLSDIGKVYLMFVAGLEIDLAEFRRKRGRSLGFGVLTFIVPLAGGFFVASALGMEPVTAVLIGSLMASHTLLAYPIVSRLGLGRSEPVTVTVGATIFTDISALLVLAVCLSIQGGDFSIGSLIGKLVALGLYALLVLVGLDTLGKEYFRRTGNDESNQFLFVLLAVFLASVGAQLLDTDKIVGAFLAGLAVNDVVEHSPVEEKVEFVGSALFIPFFFVDIGLLLDFKGFTTALTSDLMLTISLVGVLLAAKLVAAVLAKLAFRYTWNEALLMWSLSMPQVAATLAAALAALNAGAIGSNVFNATIVMMVVTAVLGPVLSQRFGDRAIAATPVAELAAIETAADRCDLEQRPSTAIVAIKNRGGVEYLSLLGAALARKGGRLVPASVAVANAPISKPEVQRELSRRRQMLDRAIVLGESLGLQVQPVARLDDDSAMGLTRMAHEFDADWLVVGWHETTSRSARLIGNAVDALLWSAPCSVVVAALQDDPRELETVLVAIENLSASAIELIRVGRAIAQFADAQLNVMCICGSSPAPAAIRRFEAAMSELGLAASLQVVESDRVAERIFEASNRHDLTAIRSRRFQTAGGLSVTDSLADITKRSTGSIVAIAPWEPENGFAGGAID
ncbi:MAG: cation:proton antiporter [Geitlerinemataceae cyanobacterium]